MVVINDLSLNVNLSRLIIVAVMNKTFGLMEWSLQKCLTNVEFTVSLISFMFPLSGFPFRLGVKTVDSKPSLNLFLKNFSETSFSPISSSIKL